MKAKTLPERTTLKLEATGESKKAHPIIEVVPGEGGTYVWIGDDDHCVGTLWSKKDLRKLRDALSEFLDA